MSLVPVNAYLEEVGEEGRQVVGDLRQQEEIHCHGNQHEALGHTHLQTRTIESGNGDNDQFQ